MKEIIKVLAKEIKRIRALIYLIEEYGGPTHSSYYKKMELNTLKRILGLMIKKELDF